MTKVIINLLPDDKELFGIFCPADVILSNTNIF